MKTNNSAEIKESYNILKWKRPSRKSNSCSDKGRHTINQQDMRKMPQKNATKSVIFNQWNK